MPTGTHYLRQRHNVSSGEQISAYFSQIMK